jgi:hypothetical protein
MTRGQQQDRVIGEIMSMVYGTDGLFSVTDAMWMGIVTLAVEGRLDEVLRLVRRIAAARQRQRVA